MYKKLLSLWILIMLCKISYEQNSCPVNSLGQNPSTAFPVCGVDTFSQTTVPICSNGVITVPGCPQSSALGGYQAKNPFWYKFTCYVTGTLGFVINPNNPGDDYDWLLYDITGHDPNDVLTDSGKLVVTGNWAGTSGPTGASGTGSSQIECASDPAAGINTFSAMPSLIQGHNYLLLVSHYTNTQSGYSLTFGGGTASITDPNIPTYVKASGICGGDKVYIKLNKPVQCKTIAADGSDFGISPPNVSISSASGYSCTTSFDTDSIIVQLNGPLSPANYSILQNVGTDGNTLLDNCFNAVPVGTNAGFTITSQQLIKAAFTYQVNYGCNADTINYFIGGQNVISWLWTIDQTKKSTAPNPSVIYKNFGQKEIKLVVYNSVCSDSAAAIINLANAPLKAQFTSPDFACPTDAVTFTDQSIGNIQAWNWDFSNGQTSNLQSPPAQSYASGSGSIIKYYPVQLSVTDSVGCTDSYTKILKVAPNCYIAVPSAFTPNGDGLNDYLYPLNAYTATNLVFRVFNRFGQVLFETTDWTKKWDGTYQSYPQPSGTYIWTLDYTDQFSGIKRALKGTTVLIR